MVDGFLRHSPLAHLGLAARAAIEAEAKAEAGVLMGERAFRRIVDLRGPAGEADFDAAVERTLGVGPPVEPNTVARAGEVTVLWQGPDEWWVVTPPDGPDTAGPLRQALEGVRAAVTEIGESRTCIHVRGPRARDLLAKGCPLDLHPGVFSSERCAQSHCAKALVTLVQVADDGAQDGPAYDLYVLNSFAEYLWRWLEDAAREYGLKVIAE